MSAYRRPDPDPGQLMPWYRPAWLDHFAWLWRDGPHPRFLQYLIAWSIAVALSATPIVLSVGCSQTALQVQAQAANGVANAANAALPILVERYRSEGVEIVLAVKQRGGTAQEARDELQGLKDLWAPVWEAWEGLRVAQGAWADALEGGGSPAAAAAALKEAYCKLLQVWPENIPAVPLAPLSCPGGAER